MNLILFHEHSVFFYKWGGGEENKFLKTGVGTWQTVVWSAVRGRRQTRTISVRQQLFRFNKF